MTTLTRHRARRRGRHLTARRLPLLGVGVLPIAAAKEEWRRSDSERGDVPGWVLVTLMTAGLVLVIWALAGPALTGVFQQAIDRVTGF